MVVLTHALGFSFRHFKETGIKHGKIILKKIATLGIERSLLVRIRVVVRFGVEAVAGHLSPSGSHSAKHSVELARCRHIAREPAGHAYNGNGYRFLVRHGAVCCLKRVDMAAKTKEMKKTKLANFGSSVGVSLLAGPMSKGCKSSGLYL